MVSMAIKHIAVVLNQLQNALRQINNEQYVMPLQVYSGGSIGAHGRHIVEVFSELVAGYELGTVNYENRKRDKTLEGDKDVLIEAMQQICTLLNKADKPLILQAGYDYRDVQVETYQTTYNRELAYALEHAVHHLALIKIGLICVNPYINLPPEFGLAAATVKHNNACAQ